MKYLLSIILFVLFSSHVKGQYSETFSTPNKGYLLNCVNDITGVNWALTPWDASGTCQVADLRDPTDYFNTIAAGVMESIDLDQEVCWESPLMNISAAGTVSLSVALSWVGFDSDVAANNCLTDYIRVMYSVNGGAYTMVPNQFGGNACATVSYPFANPGTSNNGSGNVTQGGITGSTLKIRVCVFTNANAEMVTIDNVSVPQAGVTIGCAAPVLSTVITQVGCSNPNSGAIDLSVSAGTPGYSYAWSNGATTQDLINRPVGTYTVTVTDAAMCSATNVSIITNAPAISLSTQLLNASCSGVADGEIDLVVSGGVPGYTYDWSNDGPETPDNDAQDLVGVGTGTYTVTVTDASGCTSTTSASIGLLPMTAYLEQFNIANKGYLANYVDDFSAVNWTMSSWAPAPPAAFGREVANFFQTSSGVLSGVDFDQDICWTSPIIDLNTGTQFSVDLSWVGFDVQVDEYINVKYSIDGGAYVTIPNAVGGGAGTIQYAAGLDQNGSITITKTGLSGGTIQIQICAQFNSNNETMTIDNVSVPNSLGVNCPGPDMSLIATNVSCNGGTNGTIKVTANNGTSPYNVSWSGPSSGNPAGTEIASSGGMYTITGLAAGTYTVTVTDAASLTATAMATVTQPTPIVLSNTQVNVLCNGAATGSIDLTVSGGTPGYTYVWSSGQTTQDRSGLVAGTYTVTVTDANGCTKTSSATITEPLVIALTTVVTNVACNGAATGAIDLTVTGGTGGKTYDWSNDGPENPDNDPQDLTGLIPGTYTVTVTDVNGCTKSSTATITQPPALVLSTSQVNVSCNGAATGAIDLTVIAGTPGYTYLWSTGQTTQDRTGLIAGTYTVTVTDANGCTKTSSATITQPTPIVLSTMQVDPTCGGVPNGSIDLIVSGGTPGYTYDWSNDGPENPDNDPQDLSGVASGMYTVTVTDVNGCTKTSSTTLTQAISLAMGDRVYKDNNHNGLFDSGDVGIGNVSLSIYNDVDNNGMLTVADGAAIFLTTTLTSPPASLGLWSITNACPGNYLIAVDPANFMAGGALNDMGVALVSSPIGGAPDPDTDIDNDDNGDPVAGFGVATTALTLAFGTEPIDDGDADNNTNYSVDFGFKDQTTVTISDVSLAEGTGGSTTAYNFTVTRSDNFDAFNLTVNTVDGTASAGALDFTNIVNGVVAFTAGGSLTQTVTVLVNQDNMVEANETFTVVLSAAPAGVVFSDASGLGTITNDDVATLTLSGGIAQNEGNAGITSYTFTTTLNNIVQGGFTVAYTTSNGTATTSDNDYVDNDGTLNFTGTAGETKTFTVLVNGDTKVELNETFTTTLGAITGTPAAASITIGGSPQTGTITNDDAAVVSIVANVSQVESGIPHSFSISLTNPVDVNVTVLFNTSDGTATITDFDYGAIVNQTVTFPAGSISGQMVNVPIFDDNKVEGNEVYNVAINSLNASGRNVSLGTSIGTGTILNLDMTDLNFAGGTSILEGNSGTQVVNLTLTLSQAIQGGFTVHYITNDETATLANNDYVDNDGSVFFAGNAGEAHVVTATIVGDLNIESDETFRLIISSLSGIVPGGFVIVNGDNQIMTILNDELDWGDAPTAAQSGFASSYPTLNVDGGANHFLTPGGLHMGATVDADLDGQPNATSTGDGADEDGVTLPSALVINTTANVTVNASEPCFLNAYVDFNRDGDWFGPGENIFSFQPLSTGNNNLSFTVPAGASLGTSYARFRVFNQAEIGVGGNAPNGEVEDYEVNIVNTQFSINSPAVVEGNAGTTNLVYTITRSNNLNNCSVDYAITGGTATTADLDYQPLPGGTLSFTVGGALSQNVTVVVNGDLKVELDETVIMTLSNPVNSSILNGTGTGTITNDDSGVITITSPSIVEGDAGTQNLVFNINMTAISDANVSFNWTTANGTATAGSDYVANTNNITLIPGQTTATITIVINGDCTIEANEIFTVVLSALNASGRNITFSGGGATLAGTGTIINEDFLPVITFCPPNTTISCEASTLPANTGTATATDDCLGVVVSSSDAIVQGNCVNNYIINRTWKATDNTNDMATCLQTITVRDITAPSISCPGNVTVTCASQVPFPNPESGFITGDNCGGGVFVTFVSDAIINQVCTNRFQLARTYRATDACGNSATCQQTITVFDNIAPQLNCPAPQTFQCASDVPAPNPALVTSTDNCAGGSTVTFVNDVITNQTCVNKFTLTRTYRATDACGNSATCAQVFTVNDNTVPQLTCPAGLTVQCASLIPAPNVALVTATDNCSGVPTVTFVSDVNSNVICTNKFTVTRTYRATDLCGNSAICTQTIIVNDNTVPTITCPINVTVQCASQVPAVNIAGVVTADNCGPAPTVTFVNDVISNQTCTNRFIVTRIYRSTDACGNSATCAQVITVFDNITPTLTCPANVTVQCATLVPAVNTAGVITADNCNAIPTVTFVGDVISNQTCVNRFIVTRTYRSTDECGNSATCAQIITVFDNTAPVITFADPLIANLPNGGRFDVQCHGQDPNWALPVLSESSVTTTDNCNGTVTIGFSQLLQAEGNCPVDGYITLYKLTWTATDACGNSSTKYVFMALVDHIAPVLFNIPEDITVHCDEIPTLPTNVYATDECIAASDLQYAETHPVAGCQNGQVIMRSWIATDLCGNKSTKTQHITLVDNTPPVIQMLQPELADVADETIIKYTCNEGGIPEFYDDLSAESVYSVPSCGSNAIIKFDKNTIHAVNCKRAGYLEQQTFHWYAIDNCGNETSLIIIAQLVDKEAPVISGVPDTACIDDLALKFIEATDNCGEAFLRYWDIKIPNPCGSGFAIRRTYEANDHCGNFSRDTSILIPNDHAGPVLTFVNPILKNLTPGEVFMTECSGKTGDYTPFDVEDVSVQDGCSSEVTVTFKEKVLESNGCTDGIVATLSLEWTAADVCGNVSKLAVQAFVIDTTPPVLLNFKPEITIGCKDSLPTISATDNCGEVHIDIALSTMHRQCDYKYDVLRVITATDPCGNTITGVQTIHVGDGSGPIISGVVPELCDDLSIPDITALDPCSGQNVPVTMTEKQLDSPCRDGRLIERTWTATDACGNVNTVKQIIIIGDKTPPEIQIPTYSIILKYLNAPGKSFVNLSETGIIEKLNDLDDGSVYVTDECDLQVIPQFTLDVTYSGNCAAEGYFEHRVYTWSATDICGNSSSVSFDVYVMDDIAPVLIGVPKGATIICAQLPPVPFVSSPDPAQPVSIVYTQTILPGNGAGVFDVTRIWTGTDACGNVTVERQHITWIPDTFLECEIDVPQLVECNSHGVVISSNVTGGLGGYTYYWEVIGQGFIQSGQGTDQISIYVGWTELTIILTITDGYGCTTTCSTAFQCLDTAINPYAGDNETKDPTTINDPGQSPLPDNESARILSSMSLWPNPVKGSVNLSFTSHANQEVKYRLINFLGQVMLDDKIEARKGPNTQKIDVSGVPDGSYLMEMKTEGEMYSRVVIVLHNQ